MSQLRGRGGVLLCRSEKQVLVAVRRGEAVLGRLRNEMSLKCFFFTFFPVPKTAMQISPSVQSEGRRLVCGPVTTKISLLC